MKILQIRNSESGIFPGHKIILNVFVLDPLLFPYKGEDADFTFCVQN